MSKPKKVKVWYPNTLLGSSGYLSLSTAEEVLDIINGEYDDYMKTPRYKCESITLSCNYEADTSACHKLLDVLADKVAAKDILYLPEIIVNPLTRKDHGGVKVLRAKVKVLTSMWNKQNSELRKDGCKEV